MPQHKSIIIFHLYWPVCEPLDLITGWHSFGSYNFHPTLFCVCKSNLHNRQEEICSITSDKTLSVQQYSWDIWCELFTVHKASQVEVRAGLSHSRRSIFLCWTHFVIELLLRLGLFSCCITQIVELQQAAHSPAKCPDKLGNSVFNHW